MIEIIGKTHIAQRSINEDRFVADTGWGFAIVSDGMGGADAGEVAADIVVSTMVDLLDQEMPLNEAVVQSNAAVKNAASAGVGKSGMGATLVAAVFTDHDYELAWIGDSRAYLWNGELRRITRDHSRVENLLENGSISLAEARASTERNVITRAMGLNRMNGQDVPVLRSRLARGQRLLLCSDGVTDMLSGAELAVLFAAGTDSNQLLDSIVQSALDAGGSDNITAVLVTADENGPDPDSVPLPSAAAVTEPGGQPVYYPPEEIN